MTCSHLRRQVRLFASGRSPKQPWNGGKNTGVALPGGLLVNVNLRLVGKTRTS